MRIISLFYKCKLKGLVDFELEKRAIYYKSDIIIIWLLKYAFAAKFVTFPQKWVAVALSP